MKITASQLSIINMVLQVDNDGKTKQYSLPELSTASDIFKEIKKCVEDDRFVDGSIELTSEQKVFISRQIDERTWAVLDADVVFSLKELIK